MSYQELKSMLDKEKAKRPSNQDRDMIESIEYQIAIVLSQPKDDKKAVPRFSYRSHTALIDGCEVILIVFQNGTRPIGWTTNTSCADGQLPTTLGEVFPNGALCFLIALFMSNMDFFRQRNLHTPSGLVEFLRHRIPEDIKHGQFEDRSIRTVAQLLGAQIEVVSTRLDIMPVTRHGNGRALHPVYLNVATGHYMVPGIDMPINTPPPQKQVDTPPRQNVCDACTFVNHIDATNCDMCGAGFGGNRDVNQLG